MEQEIDDDQFPARLEGDGVEHGSLRDNSSSELILMRQSLKAWHWIGYKRMFDLAALICGTDRQYEKVHKAIMDIAAEQERSMVVIVGRLFPKEKEKKA
jgi:hypothetical protein